jgi:hypothetical protein
LVPAGLGRRPSQDNLLQKFKGFTSLTIFLTNIPTPQAKSICVPHNYVKFELPPDSPTVVNIGIDIKDIPKVSDRDFTVTLNAYFIVKWYDARVVVTDNMNR